MELKHCVLKTLEYSAIFNFPLTSKEVYKYLITDIPFSYKDVKKSLAELHSLHKISKVSKYYCLNKKCAAQATKRKQFLTNSNVKVSVAKKDLKVFSKLPFIKFIGITGSVAAKNTKPDDDIDLLIITTPNCLWLTRMLLVLYLKRLRKYKYPYCPNIYMNIADITWPKKNLYVANEVARLVSIYNDKHTYELFLLKNSWVFEYLANLQYYFPKFHIIYKQSILSKLFYPIDFVLYKIQFWFMRRKITTENVSLGFIHFLKNDYSGEILSDL